MFWLDMQTVIWAENQLNERAQRMVISDTKSCWRLVTNPVPQGSVLSPILFNFFLNELDNDTECILNNWENCDKVLINRGLCCHPGTPQQVDKNLMHKRKYKVLLMERNNTMCHYILGVDELASSLAEKDLWVLVATSLNRSQKCFFAVKKSNGIPGSIRQTIACKWGNMVFPL